MTSSAFVPTNQAAQHLDVCIDKERRRLMTGRTVLDVYTCGPFRVVSTQSTPRPRSLVHLPRRHRPTPTVSCSPPGAAQTTQYP